VRAAALRCFPDRGDDLPRLREAARYGLREHDVAVDLHVEDAAAPLYQRRIQAEFFLDRGRQAGGAGFVPSSASICNPDFHLLPPMNYLPKYITSANPETAKNPPSRTGFLSQEDVAVTG
jgi:hypothetical protein